jgi:Xaa-Pro aminopeptidase
MTRFGLAHTAGTSARDLVDRARGLGLDAVAVSWPDLSAEDRDALVDARAIGVQTTAIDLGALENPVPGDGTFDDLLDFSAAVSARRWLVTATGDATGTFAAGLATLAERLEGPGISLVVRSARSGETAGTVRGPEDVRAVLAAVNRGNVHGQLHLDELTSSGADVERATGNLVGRIADARIGDGAARHDDVVTRFLLDLATYGYADVVTVEGADETVAHLLDTHGGNDTADTARVEAVQQHLADEGLDAAVFNLSKNIVALTGYWPMNGTIVALVPREGDPHLFVPTGEETWAARSGWHEVHMFQSGRTVDPPLVDTVAAMLGAVGAKLGLHGATIGVEGPVRAQVPPHMAHESSGRHDVLRPAVAAALDAKLRNLSDGFTRVRARKTERELRGIRKAAAIADVGLATFRDGLAEGVRDIDLATEVEARLERFGVGFQGVSRVRGYAFVMSGPQTSQTHLDYEFSSPRVQHEGDSVLMEMAVVADGYWQDLARIFVIGEVTEQQQRLHDTAEAAFRAAAEAAVPGATGHEVDLAARRVIEEAGLAEAYPHQTGHGVGVAFHEQYPLIKPGSDHVLEAGNVIAIEPGVYVPGVGGVRNEDNLVVGDPAGATSLQTVPHAANVPVR